MDDYLPESQEQICAYLHTITITKWQFSHLKHKQNLTFFISSWADFKSVILSY